MILFRFFFLILEIFKDQQIKTGMSDSATFTMNEVGFLSLSYTRALSNGQVGVAFIVSFC